MKYLRILSVIPFFAFGLTACEQDTPAEEAAEEQADALEDRADAIEEAAD